MPFKTRILKSERSRSGSGVGVGSGVSDGMGVGELMTTSERLEIKGMYWFLSMKTTAANTTKPMKMRTIRRHLLFGFGLSIW